MALRETDLFEPVKQWLEKRGWEVYSEVEAYAGRADIVAKQHPVYGVVEMKTSLTHELVDQALRWLNYAHYVWIAIPARKKHFPYYLRQLFEEKGIGVLEVYFSKYYLPADAPDNHTCQCYLPARYNRPVVNGLKKTSWKTWPEILREEHKTWLTGGSNGGGYVTPYKLTMRDVKEYLRRESYFTAYLTPPLEGDDDPRGWVSIDKILEHCETHYARPKPSLVNALMKFEKDWCEARKIGGKWHFRYRRGK